MDEKTLFFVPQNKVSQTGLKQHESEKMACLHSAKFFVTVVK